MIDLGTGNNNKINWTMEDKQEMIDIVETVYRGARKGRGLVVSPKDYSTKYRYWFFFLLILWCETETTSCRSQGRYFWIFFRQWNRTIFLLIHDCVTLCYLCFFVLLIDIRYYWVQVFFFPLKCFNKHGYLHIIALHCILFWHMNKTKCYIIMYQTNEKAQLV